MSQEKETKLGSCALILQTSGSSLMSFETMPHLDDIFEQ